MILKNGMEILVVIYKHRLFSYSPRGKDVYLSSTSNFHIITGPNMVMTSVTNCMYLSLSLTRLSALKSGKTTYLKQVALIVIMAQIGCFVPAKYCSLRLTDRIMSRIGTSDSIGENTGTFSVEMKEMVFILDHITDSSLILIDELGRGGLLSLLRFFFFRSRPE